MKIGQMLAMGIYVLGGVFSASTAHAAPPNGLLYTSVKNYEDITVVNAPYDSAGVVHYTTIAGYDRQVPYTLRYPTTAKGPLPVVIWAHGGGGQPMKNDPRYYLPQWSNVTAHAGYISVSILHVSDTPDQAQAMCNALGLLPLADADALANGIAALTYAKAANPVSPDPSVVQGIINTYPELSSLLNMGTDSETDIIDLAIAKLQARLDACRSITQNGTQNRPNDIQAVMDAIRAHSLPDFPYDLVATDPTQIPIVAAGHSNGTNTSLSTVGHQRAIANGVRIVRPTSQFPGTRVVAAIALSPQGINDKGIFDTGATGPNQLLHSWSNVDKDVPVMMITGDGDNRCVTDRFICTSGESPTRRAGAYSRLSADGNKYLMYLSERFSPSGKIVATHEVFGGDLMKCVDDGSGQCAETAEWLKSTVLAFLDAVVLGEPKAKGWLKSDNLLKASRGVADITLK